MEPIVPDASGGARRRAEIAVLLASVFLISTCGLLYELLIGTISTYFLGAGVLHFSITIGLFLSAMGLGSFLSRFVRTRLLERFIYVEILLGILGGLTGLLLHFAYVFTEHYYLVAGILILLLGTCIGMEIPLATRILRPYGNLRNAVSQVFSFDYVGSLIGAVLFPLVLLPILGTMRTGFVIGALNLGVALLCLRVFRKKLLRMHAAAVTAFCGLALLVTGFAYANALVGVYEQKLYDDTVLYSEQSAYQQIVLTKSGKDFRLYLNGNLQFSTQDEYRYHEPLVHLPMLLAPAPREVLVLGGGDGLAARELLKYGELQTVTVVDLDPAMTRLAAHHPLFRRLNLGSMQNPKVHIRNQDAYKFLESDTAQYDLILIDLPDPNDYGLGKLYSQEFYREAYRCLRPGGILVTQATSAYFAPKAFWCICHTVRSVFGAATLPYFTHVPSFGGVWGFVLSQRMDFLPPEHRASAQDSTAFAKHCVSRLMERLRQNPAHIRFRYLEPSKLSELFIPDPDFREVPTEINRLENQVLVRYYEESWENWY